MGSPWQPETQREIVIYILLKNITHIRDAGTCLRLEAITRRTRENKTLAVLIKGTSRLSLVILSLVVLLSPITDRLTVEC